jgi:hypothetical protein
VEPELLAEDEEEDDEEEDELLDEEVPLEASVVDPLDRPLAEELVAGVALLEDALCVPAVEVRVRPVAPVLALACAVGPEHPIAHPQKGRPIAISSTRRHA